MSLQAEGYVLEPADGDSYWFFNTLTTVKAAGQDTHEAFTLMEFTLPSSFGPPPHIHRREDEGFYVLEGELNVMCGDNSWTLGPGGYAMLPRDVPHSFMTGAAGPVRMLQITSPSQFEHYAAEMGEPAQQHVLPEPQPIDPHRVMEIGLKYGIEFLPPPE